MRSYSKGPYILTDAVTGRVIGYTASRPEARGIATLWLMAEPPGGRTCILADPHGKRYRLILRVASHPLSEAEE